MTTATKMQPVTQSRYNYQDTLTASQKANWRIEDIIGGDKRISFAQPFMPESFARVEEFNFLTIAEKLKLNQIRGFDYLCMFGLVEEFILPFVLDHARPQLQEDDYRTRAFLQFAGEEAKHIHLFKTFRAEFEAGFGTECSFIGPPEAIGKAVLNHDPLAVALVILMIEWMTLKHYTESVQNNQKLDPLFVNLLKHHWMEEAQHAKLDTLMVEEIAAGRSATQLEKALDEFLEIGMFVDGGLRQQVEFNLENLQRSTGCSLSEDERAEFITKQHQAMRWTFLGSGLTHPNFQATLKQLSPNLQQRIVDVAPVFC